jgi:hypothetical protein
MARKRSSDRGCVGLLALSGFAFGALGCAYSFLLSQTRSGEEVTFAVGLTYYLGWVCGMGLAGVGVIFSILSAFMRSVGGVVDRFGDGDGEAGLDDLLPGGLGAVVGGGLLSRFLGRRD